MVIFMPKKSLWGADIDLLTGKPVSKGERKSCPKTVKEAVWREYIGNKMNGKCYVCKTPITFTNFEVGHNKAQSKGGKWTVANCRPICRTCNRSMGTMTLEAFKKKYFGKKKPTAKKPIKRKPKPKNPWDVTQYIPKIKPFK